MKVLQSTKQGNVKTVIMELMPAAEPPQRFVSLTSCWSPQKKQHARFCFLEKLATSVAYLGFFLVELFGQCKHFRISIRKALTTFTSWFLWGFF